MLEDTDERVVTGESTMNVRSNETGFERGKRVVMRMRMRMRGDSFSGLLAAYMFSSPTHLHDASCSPSSICACPRVRHLSVPQISAGSKRLCFDWSISCQGCKRSINVPHKGKISLDDAALL
jgi:hypothetical protein